MCPKAISVQIPIDVDLMHAQLVEIGIFGPKAVLNTSPLSSGRVRRTHCQISAGADAPVAPVLTRSLVWKCIDKNNQCSEEKSVLSMKSPFSVQILKPTFHREKSLTYFLTQIENINMLKTVGIIWNPWLFITQSSGNNSLEELYHVTICPGLS